ncbi:MAG: 2-phosphosulfolactate phosphatase, partial [Bacteroidales bacterium]|nr:2-phosphosulfolactate phosphatase [Bacteroidales bacterium]
MNQIETILTPALYPFRKMNGEHNVVVVDILRATTSICTAIANGVKAIIPVRTIE